MSASHFKHKILDPAGAAPRARGCCCGTCTRRCCGCWSRRRWSRCRSPLPRRRLRRSSWARTTPTGDLHSYEGKPMRETDSAQRCYMCHRSMFQCSIDLPSLWCVSGRHRIAFAIVCLCETPWHVLCSTIAGSLTRHLSADSSHALLTRPLMGVTWPEMVRTVLAGHPMTQDPATAAAFRALKVSRPSPCLCLDSSRWCSPFTCCPNCRLVGFSLHPWRRFETRHLGFRTAGPELRDARRGAALCNFGRAAACCRGL